MSEFRISLDKANTIITAAFAKGKEADERVHEPSDRPRRHLERFGKDTLGHRAALTQLPQQMQAGRREVQSLDRLRHVVVQQNDELEDMIEHAFILMYLVYSEV